MRHLLNTTALAAIMGISVAACTDRPQLAVADPAAASAAIEPAAGALRAGVGATGTGVDFGDGTQGQTQAATRSGSPGLGQVGVAEQFQPIDCSRSFVRIDSDGDGMISPTEAVLATDSEFDRIDDDGSDTITRAEWHSCGGLAAASHGEDHPLATTSDFSEMDFDQSGDVTREEAARAAAERYTGDPARAERVAWSYGERFDNIDIDANGTLTYDEWSGGDSIDLDGRFERLDTDGDGHLSREEYAQARIETQAINEPMSIWNFYTL